MIVFEGSALWRDPLTGVGRAFLTTLGAYLQLTTEPVAMLWPGDRADATRILGELRDGVRLVPAPATAPAKQLRLPGQLRALDARLLHSPVAAVPLRASCPVISTVHDLPWMAPGGAADGDSRLRRWLTRRYLLRADAVLVPSAATARDVASFAGAAVAARIAMVPHGVAPPPHLDAPRDEAAFLVLGDDRPRKNRARVAAAHRRALVAAPELPPLRFVGPPDAWVEEDEKWRRLRSCRALIHCSLWEGFGLPVLEAFAVGVPVVCSDRGALAELVAGAALVVDPTDDAAIAGAMVAVHRDAALRARLRAAGLRRAADFPVGAAAEAWLDLHRRTGA